MALGSGFWGNNYWPDDFWDEDYWPNIPSVSSTTIYSFADFIAQNRRFDFKGQDRILNFKTQNNRVFNFKAIEGL